MIAPIALTCGEPAGIGLEIALGAWQRLRGEVDFFLIADGNHLRAISGNVPVVEIADPAGAVAAMPDGLPFLNHDFPAPNHPGTPSAANAAAVVAVIDRAVDLVQRGSAGAVVTNPIHKKALHDGADFAFAGHTEYLAQLGGVRHAVMMLAAPGLRVVPVTVHMALADVPRRLTPDLLRDTIRITHTALLHDFGISSPRLAITGLNPHAGEGGAMGDEETGILMPVLQALRQQGMDLTGPLAADSMFHADARKTYDAAIAMYHDQALIPLKTLDFHNGTNVTLGLPFVRTSPDHGTALDIAGKGLANPSSLIAALRQAASLAQTRAGAT